jgi:bacterioferritin-associated ferredoxin
MYICLCNALTEKDVESAVAGGARNLSTVYRSHGCKVRCGKCTCQVRDIIRTRSSAPAAA